MVMENQMHAFVAESNCERDDWVSMINKQVRALNVFSTHVSSGIRSCGLSEAISSYQVASSADESYLIDNRELHSTKLGIQYRFSPNIGKKDRGGELAFYGTVVHGTPEDDWLRVETTLGIRFLPFYIEGLQVLRRLDQVGPDADPQSFATLGYAISIGGIVSGEQETGSSGKLTIDTSHLAAVVSMIPSARLTASLTALASENIDAMVDSGDMLLRPNHVCIATPQCPCDSETDTSGLLGAESALQQTRIQDTDGVISTSYSGMVSVELLHTIDNRQSSCSSNNDSLKEISADILVDYALPQSSTRRM